MPLPYQPNGNRQAWEKLSPLMPVGSKSHESNGAHLDGADSIDYIERVNEGQEEDRKQRIDAILEINQRTRELQETVEGLGDLRPVVSLEELEEVRGKMTLLREQGYFWLAERNPQRFSYDLKNFQSWLLAFLGDRSPRNKA